MLDIYKLQHQYLSLQSRTRALRSAKSSIPVEEAEGFELTEKTSGQSSSVEVSNEKVMAIKKEWRGWKLASIKNTYVTLFPLVVLPKLQTADDQRIRPTYCPLGCRSNVDQPTYHWCPRLYCCYRKDS